MKRLYITLTVHVVKIMASYTLSRALLNVLYTHLSSAQKKSFHARFAKIFRSKHRVPSEGTWRCTFLGKTILMPLTKSRFWLDWDTAVSIVGNDREVKGTYEALIASSERPTLFLDIGANYGTHSLLFLVQGIETISFEPNSSCHAYMRTVCMLNHVTPSIEPVALGDVSGSVELSYPESDTWLGTINPLVRQDLRKRWTLRTQNVMQKTLDHYRYRMKDHSVLIKIDTEGGELGVLRGARETLRFSKPLVIFESHKNPHERTLLSDFFAEYEYEIFNLPWSPHGSNTHMHLESFQASVATNFIAVPKGYQRSL